MSFARGINNPIGVKISDQCTPEELLRLCDALDPMHVPGRLVVMVRMGAQRLRKSLPALIVAVRESGHPVVWMSDPMHGNTQTTATGIKTRAFEDVLTELLDFVRICREHGVPPGGVHLELTPEDVTECTGGSWASDPDDLTSNYQSLCDPRLNGTQALDISFLLADFMSTSRPLNA